MSLTNEQMERYYRNIILKEVGVSGQERLYDGRVLVIGAGGLGSPASMYLAAAGVGTIGIADADEVDLSNLQRQILHTTADIGRAKVDSAKETLCAINPDINVKTYHELVTAESISQLIADYNFILDATDNFTAKFLINDACVMAGKPFSHAGISRFQGQLMTYVPPAKTSGVIGALAGVIGSMQALEAVKFFTGAGGLLTGRLLTYNALNMEFHTVKLPGENSKCSVHRRLREAENAAD